MTVQPRKQSNSPRDDEARLHALQVMLCARIEDLLDKLGVDMVRTGKMYFGPCPVHGGDNQQACNLYHSGDTVPGYWKCWTGRCEQVFRKTILGFVRGVLSQQRHGWTTHRSQTIQDKQATVSFRETVDWCCEFLGQRLEDVRVDHSELEKRRFTGDVATLNCRPRSKPGISRESVRQWLQIPATYFVGRGWGAEVLDRYDVGLYPVAGKPLSDRVAVPVYDEVGKNAIGFTARSIFEQCPSCRRWHNPSTACPDGTNHDALNRTAKWFNHNFNRDSVLYNWWFARKHIEETGVACLVEGPGDLWRLEEAGIHCGLALLGATLSEQQQVLLEMSGAMTLLVLTNMDPAGRGAADALRQQVSRLFRLVFPELPSKDLGEMGKADVDQLVRPLVEKHRRKF